jgi:hypothetical protein
MAELDKQIQKITPEISTLGREYQEAKRKFEEQKRKNSADVQKLNSAQSAYDAAVKKVDSERPWYVKAGNATINAVESTITFGKKVFKITDWDMMEKAVTAAGIAVGKAKDPPQKLVNALDTAKKYLGYINLAISVNDAVDSLKALITAGQSYSNATSDSQRRDAVESISISTLNFLEKGLNIKGGVISSVASACNLFCTALVKALAAVNRLTKNSTAIVELNWLVSNFNHDDNIVRKATNVIGASEVAVNMIQANKTDAQVLEAVEAYATIKKAS